METVKDVATLTRIIKSQQISQVLKLQLKSEQDQETLETIREFLRKKSDLEQTFGKDLAKLATNYHKRFARPTDDSDPFYSACANFIGSEKEQAQRKYALGESTLKHSLSLKEYIKEKHLLTKKSIDYAQKYHLQLHQSYDDLADTAKLYTKYSKEADSSQKRYDDTLRKPSSLFKIGDPEERIEKMREKSKASSRRLVDSRNAYIVAIDSANSQQSIYYSHDLHRLIQKVDNKVYHTSMTILNAYFDDQKKDLEANANSYNHISRVLSAISVETQTSLFVERNSACFLFPPRFVFELVGNDHITNIVLDEITRIQLGQRLVNMQSRLAELLPALQKKVKELEGIQSLVDTYAKNPSFGNSSSPLEQFMETEILVDLMRLTQTKIVSRIKLLEDAGVVYTRPAAPIPIPESNNVTALYDYLAIAANEISIIKGSCYQMIESEADGWMKVSDGLKEGYIPANYVEVGSSAASFAVKGSLHDSLSDLNILLAIYDYEASDSLEISLKAGDEIKVTEAGEAVTDAWWTGFNTRTSKTGSFPLAFTQGWEKQRSRLSRFSTSSLKGSVYGRMHSGKGDSFKQSLSALGASPRESIEEVRHPNHQEAHETVKVLYAYEATCIGELTLVAGERIQIINKNTGSDSWWEGIGLRGTGQFPSNYVGAIKDVYCFALYDYAALNDDELSIAAGDVILVENADGDWWTGSLNGSSGCFPSNFVENMN